MTEDSTVAVGGDSDEAECYIGTSVGLQNKASRVHPRLTGEHVPGTGAAVVLFYSLTYIL